MLAKAASEAAVRNELDILKLLPDPAGRIKPPGSVEKHLRQFETIIRS